MKLSRILLQVTFIFVLTSVCLLPLLAQVKNDRKLLGLKGLVQKVEVGWIEKKQKVTEYKITNTAKYDLEGHEIEDIRYANSPGKPREPFLKVVTSVNGAIVTQKIYDVHKPSKDGVPGTILSINSSPPPPPKTEPDGSVLSQAVAMFDELNNRYKESWYKGLVNKGTLDHRIVFIVNKNNLLEEELWYYTDSKNPSKSVHTYDSNNLEVAYLQVSSLGKVETKNTHSKYKLDSKGNWIERVTNMSYMGGNGIPINISEIQYRKISYYPSAK